jgi:3-isopropylmalate dehydratase small subunit
MRTHFNLVYGGEFQRYCLLEGLDDIGLTLRHEEANQKLRSDAREPLVVPHASPVVNL